MAIGGLKEWAHRVREAAAPHRVVAVFGLISALVLLFLTPPIQAPDEELHFRRALSVSHGEIWPRTLGEKSGTYGPASFNQMVGQFFIRDDPRIPLGETLGAFDLPAEPEAFLALRTEAIYPPQGYLPQALGMAVGNLLGLGPAWLLLLGRLANLAFATAIIVYAVKRMPVGREAAMLLALLPMTLSLTASLNPDASSIAGGFLFAALLTASFHDGRWDWKRLAGIAFAGFLMCSTKVVFVPLLAAGGALLLMREAPWGKKIGVVAAQAVFAILIGAWLLYFASATDAAGGSSAPGVDGDRQLAFVLGDPLGFLVITARTIVGHAPYLVQSTIGVLSWNSIYLTEWVYGPILLAAPLALLASRHSESPLPWLAHAGFALLMACVVLLVYLGLYMIFTPVGADRVGGIQGRYFIPMLPLAAYSATVLAGPARRLLNPDLSYLAVVAAVVWANVVTWVIVADYFRPFG